MGKGKEVIVSWDDLDDDDLFDEDPFEPSQSQFAPTKDDATPTAATVALARIVRKPGPDISTPANESYLGKQDLRSEVRQLGTSSSNINVPGQLRSVSGTSAGTDHHIDSYWKSESDWRGDRKRTSKQTLHKGDLRDAITTMTRQMKDLHSPGTRATESIRAPQSRPLESGITLVAIRTSSDPKPSSSSGRPSASDVIAAPPKWDSYRPRSRSGSRSRGKESSRRKKSRSRSRGRSWSRSRRRSWSRSRGRARSRSRDRSRDRNTSSRHRSRSRGRSRSRDRRRSREWSRSRDDRKSRGRSRDKDTDKGKDKEKDKDKERNRDEDNDRDKDSVRDRGGGRDRDVDKWMTSSRSTSTDKSKPRGMSRTRSTLPTKAEEKPGSWTNSVSREANAVVISASPSAQVIAQTSNITITPTTTSTTLLSLSTPLSACGSPADESTAPSSSLSSTECSNPTTLSQTTTLSSVEVLTGSLDLTQPYLLNTTTTSSSSSPGPGLLQTTDPNLASELQDPATLTNIKVEAEDPPTLAQVMKTPSPEVAAKQETHSSDDATIFLRQASQPTTSALGLADPMEAEEGTQDLHYFVIRVSDEGDFNDARRSNVWNTNAMYDKTLRELYSPTSQVFLIFTVFMSGEFCGIAKMASEIMWVGERTIFDKSNLRQKFKLQWVACSRVSYDSVKELTHEPIYRIIRKNGYELPQDIGGSIHKLLVENQPEQEPQLTLSLQEADSSALDITATSFSHDMLMGESSNAQESSTLHFNSPFRDNSDMDVDLPEPMTSDFQGKDKDEGEVNVDHDGGGLSMDLDSNSDTTADFIEVSSSKATLLHSPRARKRSLSADENADLSMERTLANEEQKQQFRGRSTEPTIERQDRRADDEEEKEEGDEEMEKGEAVSLRDVSPIRARSPRRLNSPPPSFPSRPWSPSIRRSSPPPQIRSSRRRSPPPPSLRYWSPPPPSLRRNRSPPPPRRRLPPRRSPPPPSHYHQPLPYERSGSTASTSSTYYGFRSPPPFPQRSKDPRDRSTSTYVFHSGSEPNNQHDRFSNAPMDPRLSVNRGTSSSVVPQKRSYGEASGSMENGKGTVLADAVDLPASVFPLADDDDDNMSGHFIPPLQSVNPSAAGASSSLSSPSAAPGDPSSSTLTAPSADPPPQITSITLVPSGMSKSRRKKLRKEALAKPLDF